MVVTVLNPKGGSAKSTVSLHLAAALSDLGRTALVDLDADNRTSLDYAAAGRLPFTVTDPETWAAGLNREVWAHVVADTYARPPAAQLAQLAQLSDLFVVPTPCDAVSLRVLARYLPDLGAVGARYVVVLVQVPPWPSRAGERARRDLVAGGVPLLTTEVPRAAAFVNAARARRLAWDVPGGRRLALVFDELTREVLAHADET